MEQRHDHLRLLAAGGHDVEIHAVAEIYPRAGVLASWLNAALDSRADVSLCPVVGGDNPFNGSATTVEEWQLARMQLREALSALLSKATGPARCVLPVPGDPGGLPAGLPTAAAAGQAVLVPVDQGSLVLVPTSLQLDEAATWQGLPGPGLTSYAADPRAARAEVLSQLTQAVEILESLPSPSRDQGLLRQRLQRLDLVPLAPGSSGPAAELARLSARLLTIVAAAIPAADPGTSSGRAARELLVPLGRVGRAALAIAFSEPSQR